MKIACFLINLIFLNLSGFAHESKERVVEVSHNTILDELMSDHGGNFRYLIKQNKKNKNKIKSVLKQIIKNPSSFLVAYPEFQNDIDLVYRKALVEYGRFVNLDTKGDLNYEDKDFIELIKTKIIEENNHEKVIALFSLWANSGTTYAVQELISTAEIHFDSDIYKQYDALRWSWIAIEKTYVPAEGSLVEDSGFSLPVESEKEFPIYKRRDAKLWTATLADLRKFSVSLLELPFDSNTKESIIEIQKKIAEEEAQLLKYVNSDRSQGRFPASNTSNNHPHDGSTENEQKTVNLKVQDVDLKQKRQPASEVGNTVNYLKWTGLLFLGGLVLCLGLAALYYIKKIRRRL